MTGRSKKREDRTRARILDLLERNKDGLTISDVARSLSIHYTTVSKYLAVMEAEQKITHRDIGMAKVFRVR